MNNQTFFLIIVVIILIFYMDVKKSTQQSQEPQQTQQTQEPQQTQQTQPQESTGIFDSISQLILPKTQQTQQTQLSESQNIINEYLNENECKENFNTMGPNMNIGNNMDFKQQVNSNPSPLSKAMNKSLVPDFQPNYLNINPDLNSYGYATTNPEADKFYEARGFMNPTDGYKFADSVSYMLSHPYQTRYCEKQN